jgi:DNA-binding transcriptional LysR family regulator
MRIAVGYGRWRRPEDAMEMHQIRYFLAVAETLNFTRAAEQCNVTQPSLTRAIQKLEDEMGGLLFSREHHNTHLTELGRLVHPHLEAIYSTNAAVLAEAKQYRAMERAPLKLGVMCTIGPARLVGFFEQLKTRIPMLDLQIRDMPAKPLVEALLAGELDVALVALPSFPERCTAKPLFTERYLIAIPKGHRFEAMNAVPLDELEGEDYVQRVHCEFRYHFEALGLPKRGAVNIRYHSEREDWVQAMIAAGMGCAVMPEHLPILPGLVMRVIIDPEVSRTVHLVTVAGRRFTPVEQVAIRMAQTYRWDAAEPKGMPLGWCDVEAETAPG